MSVDRGRRLRVRAFAKINLSLRIAGLRRDGYHELRTVFQSIALHDTLLVRRSTGPFKLICSDPACPADSTNLVWRAAESVWRAAGRRGAPCDTSVRIVKRIPVQAGLGGGSSDAAAAIRALAAFWRARLPATAMRRLGRRLGADVPFFLFGGTASGTGRGDRVFLTDNGPAAWIVLIVPPIRVSTPEAYRWWDEDAAAGLTVERRTLLDSGNAPAPAANDLEAVVGRRHPAIPALVEALTRAGARTAAMSGSGSAVFGLFDARAMAAAAAEAVRRDAPASSRVFLTRTIDRGKYQHLSRLAR